jgi:hypothetical protein
MGGIVDHHCLNCLFITGQASVYFITYNIYHSSVIIDSHVDL